MALINPGNKSLSDLAEEVEDEVMASGNISPPLAQICSVDFEDEEMKEKKARKRKRKRKKKRGAKSEGEEDEDDENLEGITGN